MNSPDFLFFFVKGQQKKPSLTLHSCKQHVLTSHLQPEGPAKHGPTESSSARPPPSDTTQSSSLPRHQRGKQTSLLRFHSRVGHKQLKFTSKARGVYYSLLQPAAAPRAGARLAVAQPRWKGWHRARRCFLHWRPTWSCSLVTLLFSLLECPTSDVPQHINT